MMGEDIGWRIDEEEVDLEILLRMWRRCFSMIRAPILILPRSRTRERMLPITRPRITVEEHCQFYYFFLFSFKHIPLSGSALWGRKE